MTPKYVQGDRVVVDGVLIVEIVAVRPFDAIVETGSGSMLVSLERLMPV